MSSPVSLLQACADLATNRDVDALVVLQQEEGRLQVGEVEELLARGMTSQGGKRSSTLASTSTSESGSSSQEGGKVRLLQLLVPLSPPPDWCPADLVCTRPSHRDTQGLRPTSQPSHGRHRGAAARYVSWRSSLSLSPSSHCVLHPSSSALHPADSRLLTFA